MSRNPLPPLRSLLCLSLFALASSIFAASAPHYAPAAPQITAPIDNSVTAPLPGNVHPLARPAYDRGPAPASTAANRMLLLLKRPPAREAELRQFLQDVHTPGTAEYHHWLTPAQFGDRFGPADSDIAAVQAWLQSQGFTVARVTQGKTLIEFSGTVGQVERAFHTSIHTYRVNGQMHLANAVDPSIPVALAPAVAGVTALNDFRPRPMLRMKGQALYDPSTHQATPQWTYPVQGGTFYLVSPEDFSVQYDLKPLISAGANGSGQTIGIINDSNIETSLVSAFRTLFNLTASTPQVVIDGNDPQITGDSSEAYLDVEWAGAVAPGATIKLYIGADTSFQSGLILAAVRAIEENTAPVLSLSFGACEASLGTANNSAIASLWQQAAAQGQTVLVAAGDSGSAGCDDPSTETSAQYGLAVNGFASTPYNVAVGGTDFYYSAYNQGASALQNQINSYWSANNDTNNGSLQKTLPEQPWDDSQFGLNAVAYDPTNPMISGGGGGASNCATSTSSGNNVTCTAGVPKPTWQTGTGVPNDSVRDIPDVSLFAGAGSNYSAYPICAASGDCTTTTSTGVTQVSGVGGTSAATPAMAAIMAIVNQKYGRQGQADFVLYPMAAQYGSVFHDVTVGSNNEPCTSGTPDCAQDKSDSYTSLQNYYAGANFDLASGWGSVDANALVSNWSNISFKSTTISLTMSPTSFQHGATVNVSSTVTASSGGTPSGSVALLTTSTAPENVSWGVLPLTNGSTTQTINSLPGGAYQVTAQYSGDGVFGPSTSQPVTLNVTPENSNINLSVNTYSSATNNLVSVANQTEPYGTYITADAQPTGASASTSNPDGIATGSVSFQDGTTTVSANLNSYGQAEYVPAKSYFTVGSHSISASFSGDASFNASKGGPVNFTISQAPTALAATSAAGSTSGTTAINATVTPSPSSFAANPTGTITVSANGSNLGPAVNVTPYTDPTTGYSLATAAITLTNSSIPSGVTAVTLTYSGDTNYQGSNTTVSVGSGAGQPTIAANPTSLTVAPGSSGSTTLTATGFSGSSVNFTYSVAGPAGAVDPPTCTFSPASPAINNGTATTTMTVNTTPASSALHLPLGDRHRWYGAGGAALACMLLIGMPSRRRAWRRMLGLLIVIVAAGAVGCGGSGSSNSGGGGNGGTTAGAYTVTVTATAGTVSKTITVAVTVQ